jgi:hypothetical protein
MLNNGYTAAACITMKMMESFSYADIQKHSGHLVFVKKSAKLAAHDQRQFGQKLL